MIRKKLKTIGAIAIAAAMSVALTGCGLASPYSDLNLDDYVTVGEYTGIEYEEVTPDEVTDEDVESQIESDLDAAKSTKFYQEEVTVEDGDLLNIDYEGKINGKAFDGGTDTNHSLEIGSGEFIDGFEEALIGKTVGTTVDIDVTFPKDYDQKKLAGKDATFTVKINNCIRSEVPDVETYAKSEGYSDVDSYKKAVKKKLTKEAKETAADTEKDDAWSKVMENSKAKKYPKGLVKTYLKASKASTEAMASQYGLDFNTMISYYGYETEEDWEKAEKSNCKDQIKSEMIAYTIAKNEDLLPSSKEIKAKVEEYTENGLDAETYEEEYGISLEENVTSELIYDKAAEFVVKNGKATKAINAEEVEGETKAEK